MALSAKDLRIGNYVSNQNGTLTGKLIGEFHIIDESDFSWAELYVPISLTEEWLLKLGFKQEDIQKYADNRPLQKEYCKKDLMMVRFQSNRFYAAPFGFPINVNKTLYVHQLQNLYFALTGEELTLNEKQ